jgi:hypothetical protein
VGGNVWINNLFLSIVFQTSPPFGLRCNNDEQDVEVFWVALLFRIFACISIVRTLQGTSCNYVKVNA